MVFIGNFYTDVISLDARFDSVARVSDPSLLEATTRQLVESIISARQMGIDVIIYDYRSPDRQMELFNQGATKLRIVGVHHFSLACDIVRMVGGEACWKGNFSFLGQLAHSSGPIWGGDWEIPTSNTASSTACMCSVAQSPNKAIALPEHGFPTKPTTHTMMANISLSLQLRPPQLKPLQPSSPKRPG